jgi:hypothetical protein
MLDAAADTVAGEEEEEEEAQILLGAAEGLQQLATPQRQRQQQQEAEQRAGQATQGSKGKKGKRGVAGQQQGAKAAAAGGRGDGGKQSKKRAAPEPPAADGRATGGTAAAAAARGGNDSSSAAERPMKRRVGRDPRLAAEPQQQQQQRESSETAYRCACAPATLAACACLPTPPPSLRPHAAVHQHLVSCLPARLLPAGRSASFCSRGAPTRWQLAAAPPPREAAHWVSSRRRCPQHRCQAMMRMLQTSIGMPWSELLPPCPPVFWAPYSDLCCVPIFKTYWPVQITLFYWHKQLA